MQYDVVLTRHQTNGYIACPVLWPEVVATGDSEEETLEGVRSLLGNLPLKSQQEEVESKIVQVNVAKPDPATLSEFADNPLSLTQNQKIAIRGDSAGFGFMTDAQNVKNVAVYKS